MTSKIIWTSLMKEFFFLWVQFMGLLCLIWILCKERYFKMIFYLLHFNYKMKPLLLLILGRLLQNLMLQLSYFLIKMQLLLLVHNLLNSLRLIITIFYLLLRLFVIQLIKIKNNLLLVLYKHHWEELLNRIRKIHRKSL